MSGLARPRTYAPKGTSLGIVGFLLTSAVIPPSLASVVSPFLSRATDLVGWSVLAGGAFSMLLFIPLVAALASRKYWGVCYFFVAGCSLIVCYLAVVLTSLVCKFALSPHADARGAYTGTTGLIFLLIALPAPMLLARALALKYWQPWTTPDMWEAGDERAPAWAAAATGIGDLPQGDGTRPPAQLHRRKRRRNQA